MSSGSFKMLSRKYVYKSYVFNMYVLLALKPFRVFPSIKWVVLPKSVCLFVCLFSLFNGISTFVGYLMPKPSFKKNSSDTI